MDPEAAGLRERDDREQRVRASRAENNSGWHYYSLYVADTGPNGAGGDPMSGWMVRSNTFESPAFISPSGGSNGTRWVGNLGSWDCRAGVTYRFNVGPTCSANDKAVSPRPRSTSQTPPFGWVNPPRTTSA